MNISPIRIAVGTMCALALAASHYFAFVQGGATERAAFASYRADEQTAHTQAVTTAAATQSRQSTNVIKAQNDRSTRLQSLQTDFDRVRAERDRLRNALATATADLPAPATTPGADACSAARELLSAMGAGLERLAATGAGIAQAADQHALDAKTMAEAWPK